MRESRDYADEQVQGLERYIPTTYSKALVALAIPSSLGTFVFFRENVSWFGLAGKTEAEQTLLAALLGLAVLAFMLFLLAVELTVVLSTSRHARITHLSSQYPLLSPRWFLANAKSIHLLVVGLACATIFAAGFYAGRI